MQPITFKLMTKTTARVDFGAEIMLMAFLHKTKILVAPFHFVRVQFSIS